MSEKVNTLGAGFVLSLGLICAGGGVAIETTSIGAHNAAVQQTAEDTEKYGISDDCVESIRKMSNSVDGTEYHDNANNFYAKCIPSNVVINAKGINTIMSDVKVEHDANSVSKVAVSAGMIIFGGWCAISGYRGVRRNGLIQQRIRAV